MFLVLGTALMAWVASWGTRWLAVVTDTTDAARGGRKIHSQTTPLLGGLGIGLTILISMVIATATGLLPMQGPLSMRLGGFFVGVLILLFGGVLDDVYDIPPYLQILFPVTATLVVMGTGTSILEISNLGGAGVWKLDYWQRSISIFGWLHTLRLPADLLTFAWMLGVTYATKSMDGLDGLVTGQTLIGAALIALLAASPAFYQPAILVLSLIVFAAFLGFLPWNLHPARQFLGESGSTLAGFSLGFLAIVSGAKVATAFMALGIPLVDFMLVVLLRLRSHRSPFEGDDSHLHFRLLRLGFSQRQVAAFFWMLALVFGLTAFGLQTRGKTLLVISLSCVTLLISLRAAAQKNLALSWRRRVFFGASIVTLMVVTWSLLGLWRVHRQPPLLRQITLHDHRLWLELATTDSQRMQGLSERASMPLDQGMLFVFAKKDSYAFWMPNMQFDLDIVWLNGDRVVDRARLLAPQANEKPAQYTPHEPADRVLEVRAGQADVYGLQLGARVPELVIGRSLE